MQRSQDLIKTKSQGNFQKACQYCPNFATLVNNIQRPQDLIKSTSPVHFARLVNVPQSLLFYKNI